MARKIEPRPEAGSGQPQPRQAAGDRGAAAAARRSTWSPPARSACRSREETAPDFAGNARIKALAAATASGLPALSDDSGFCVAALDGERRRVVGALGGAGQGFRGRDGGGERTASATPRTAAPGSSPRLCLAWPDGHTETFLGRVDGTAVWPPRGDKGFGYDPMFVPSGGPADLRRDGPGRKARDQPPRAGLRAGAGVLLRTCGIQPP